MARSIAFRVAKNKTLLAYAHTDAFLTSALSGQLAIVSPWIPLIASEGFPGVRFLGEAFVCLTKVGGVLKSGL